MTVDVSKSLVYVVRRPTLDIASAEAYVVHDLGQGLKISTALTFVVHTNEEVEIDDDLDISKATVYVVSSSIAGPARISSLVTDVLHGGIPSARISGAQIEALINRTPEALISAVIAEALIRNPSLARITGRYVEVLRSTAEATVSAWLTSTNMDVLYSPVTAEVRVSEVYIEVLTPASADGEAFGFVSVMN